MIRVAIMYPNQINTTFDLNYYRNQHLPLVQGKYQTYGLKSIEIDAAKVIDGPHKAPYFAIGYLLFESTKSFMAAVKAEGETIMADIKNFTNSKPIIQISEHNRL